MPDTRAYNPLSVGKAALPGKLAHPASKAKLPFSRVAFSTPSPRPTRLPLSPVLTVPSLHTPQGIGEGQHSLF